VDAGHAEWTHEKDTVRITNAGYDFLNADHHLGGPFFRRFTPYVGQFYGHPYFDTASKWGEGNADSAASTVAANTTRL